MKKENDLRYVRTNQMLCEAFTQLLTKKKFEKITINDLCEAAMVRRATFYTHFVDKYEFFSYYVKKIREQFADSWPGSKEDQTLYDFSLYMFRQLISFICAHMNLVRNVTNSSAFSILMDILSEEIRSSFLREMQRIAPAETFALPAGILPGQGTSAPAISASSSTLVEIAASYHAGGIIQILRYWLLVKKDMTQEELIYYYSLITLPYCEASKNFN